jgi:hypothetical protein
MAIPVVTSLNPLEENITFQKTTVSNKFYSSILLNYVESIEISGSKKTVFYTESSTNFNVGDRIFIVNGNYDSDLFISRDKYSKFTDGYRVLACDGCRLILDLEFTGELPYFGDDVTNSIKVNHVETQREFDYINSIKINHLGITFNNLNTSITPFATLGTISKFSGKLYNLGSTLTTTAVLFSDSIIYCSRQFLASSDPLNLNSGVSSSGFYLRDDSSSTPTWVNITQLVLDNKLRLVNQNYATVESKLYINGENFIIGSIEFKQRNTYTHLDGIWNLDIRYKKPFISRLNFRYGNFGGNHKDGVFGSFERKNNWNNATWNSGIFMNSNWNSGTMESKSAAGEKFFFSTLDKTSTNSPIQTIDFSNNRGFGFNLVEDSSIIRGDIKNGNFENCNLGIGSTVSALDVYLGQTFSYDLKISGLFKKCDIDAVETERATLNTSYVNNSHIVNSNIVNSQVVYSVGEKSQVNDEEGINVIGADLWSYNTDLTTLSVRGILKLYISDADSQKIQSGDAFYLTKLNKNLFLTSLSNDQRIKLPIENKFIFDIYSNSDLSRRKIIVSVKNKNDNKVKSIVRQTLSGYQTNFSLQNSDYSSIDIDTSALAFWENTITLVNTPPYNTGIEYCLSPILPNQIDLLFSKSSLSNLDYKNGYLVNSNWISGNNINYRHHRIRLSPSNILSIESFTPDTINVSLPLNPMNRDINIPGEDLFVGDIVWINSIEQIIGTTIKSIDGKYRVNSINVISNIKEITLSSIDGLTFSNSIFDIFRTTGADNNNYSSIHKFRIENSTINSGLFVNTSLKNNVIKNTNFNNLDKNIDPINVERLRLINIIFKNTLNQINSGYIFKSHFVNDIWNSGIILNSIWNGATFKNGIFNSGYWQSGRFLNGSFINSKDVNPTRQDYDNTTQLYRNWLLGNFDGGEFYNSVWANGTFSNGRFYNSDWYSGIWNNGILGSSNLRYLDTKMSYYSPLTISGTQTIWNDGIVENAIIGGSSSVYWYGGKFNNGEFTSFGSNTTNESIWYSGDFNNGKFTGLARWKNGKFTKGKFHSYYGMTYSSPTNSSTYSIHYGWEDGKFLGGEFGNGSTLTNSVWYTGEFKGGNFQGRMWYSGLFTKGEFFGSGSGSSIYNSNVSNMGEYNFADSFRNDYFGLWISGDVSDNPKNIKTEERVITEPVRKVEEVSIDNSVKFSNVLWMSGTFSHKNAIFENSVWLSGNFYNGTFDSSIFNAYVDRSFSGTNSSSFATTQSCVWHGGNFDSTLGTASFYISEWKSGTFNRGYMSGALWREGVWNYGFADNIIWLDGLWRNGNWNGAPFGYSDIDTTLTPLELKPGRSRDIILNVAINLGNNNKIYVNNAFSASVAYVILTDPNINSLNFSTSSVYSGNNEQYFYEETLNNNNSISNPLGLNTSGSINPVIYNSARWVHGTTFSLSGGQIITNGHVYTQTVTPQPNREEPESNRLFACINGLTPNLEVFSQPDKTYILSLQLTVEGKEKVDVFVKIGNKDEIKLTLPSISQQVGNNIFYFPFQHDITFIYTTGNPIITPDDTRFYIKKGRGGKLRVLYLSIVERVFEYHPLYNNAIISNSIIFVNDRVVLPNDPNLTVLAASKDGNLVSINIGNGIFKSGIWENGIWNNGFRSNSMLGEEDYYKFSNVVGLNGVTPYAGKGTYQISPISWLVTLQSIDTLQGLNVGDKISIGNLVAIDINENRKLIKDYFTISEIDLTFNTVVVELVTNFPVMRVERDSENHLIYLTKNIWLSGAFLNGSFRGVWNNGLFKSYPRIGTIGNTHWIDGKFDGGRFISRKSQIPLVSSYNTGLVQNFTFIDNNSVDATSGLPKWQSWIDVNYVEKTKTTINEESVLFKLNNYPPTIATSIFTYSVTEDTILQSYDGIYSGDDPILLQGGTTDDILESSSIFRDYNNRNFTYKLGTKFKIYQNFIPNGGNFTEPFSNNIGYGLDLTNFNNNGWYVNDFSSTFSITSSVAVGQLLNISTLNPVQIDSNINSNTSGDSLTANRLRLKTSTAFGSAIIQIWTPNTKIHFRFARVVLNNDNIETIRNRYYLTEVNLHRLDIKPGTWSTPTTPVYTHGRGANFNLVPNFNNYELFYSELANPSLTQRQFFFNKKNLDLNIEVFSSLTETGTPPLPVNFPQPVINNSIDILFNNISFYEVDMVPFFNYYQDKKVETIYGRDFLIDARIQTPWSAQAPFIDYSDANFDFIGNVNLTIDSETVNNQTSYTVISVGGVSGTINIPPGNSNVVTSAN